MKVKEAIKDIKTIKPIVGGISLDMAIEALEKQVPRRATTQGVSGDGYWVIKCPECETVMEGKRKMANYCCKCGQRIIWGD